MRIKRSKVKSPTQRTSELGSLGGKYVIAVSITTTASVVFAFLAGVVARRCDSLWCVVVQFEYDLRLHTL